MLLFFLSQSIAVFLFPLFMVFQTLSGISNNGFSSGFSSFVPIQAHWENINTASKKSSRFAFAFAPESFLDDPPPPLPRFKVKYLDSLALAIVPYSFIFPMPFGKLM